MRQTESRSRQAGSLGNIQDLMTRRWVGVEPAETASGTYVEIDDIGGRPDFGAPRQMDLGLRFQTARPGDSISRLLGSSDPRAIGKFLNLNNMGAADSTLRSGRSYVVPTRWDDATNSEAKSGAALLGVDNARRQAAADRWAEQARRADQFAIRLAEGRNVWTGDATRAGAKPKRFGPPTRYSPPGGIDADPTARALAGAAGWAVGLAPGVVRGGVNTLKGAAETAYLLRRLTNPLDPLLSPSGQSAAEQVVRFGQGVGEYAARASQDPSIVRADIASSLSDFRLKQDPFASPAADTLGGEFRRTFDIGMNNGELAFDVGSTVLGGAAIRGAAGFGKAAKAATAKELTFLADNPGFAARLDELYSGMSHHIVGRRAKLPGWLGGGPYPKWFIESEFNKIRHRGVTTRDFYRNHVAVDDYYHGGKVGARYGGTRWSGKRDLGWTRYGPLDRLNYGTSPYTKGVVGPVLFVGPFAGGIDEGAAR